MADYEYSDDSSSSNSSQRLQFNKEIEEVKEPQRNGFHNQAPGQRKTQPLAPVNRPGVVSHTIPS